jgi:Tol biopolymer transport system component
MNEAQGKNDPIPVPCGAAFSGRVIHSLVWLLLALVLPTSMTPASAQSTPAAAAVRLQAGIEKEDVDGDLPAAMEIYRKIAADPSAPRDVRARASLRLAGCDEKLGRPATQVYEQIVHDYADQPAAAQSRNRLELLKRREHPALPKTMTTRKIEWSELGFMGSGDTDGEHAIYSASDGNLYFSDLSGRNRHLIFRGEPGLPPGHVGSFPSRDFSMVAIQLQDKPGHLPTLATIKSDGTGYRELLRDDSEGSILGGSIHGVLVNWSWDDRTVVVGSRTKSGGAHLMVIDLASGHREEFARIDSGQYWSTRFSPDGRFIAYEILPDWRHVSIGKSRIFAKPVHGGEERQIYESPPLDMGTQYAPLKDWTTDGQFIAFKDVQDGQSALYLQPMKDGVPSEPAVFVRFGDYVDGNITMSGALVYQDRATKPTQASAYFASLDAAGRVKSWQTIDLRGGLDGHSHPWPSFSPDGTHIAYIAAEEDQTLRDLILQDLSTGQQRVLYQSATKNIGCQFSAYSPKVFCTLDFRSEGRTDLISIAADSGAVEKIASFHGSRFILESPFDDRIFHFSGKRADIGSGENDEIGGSPILRWDLATNQETIVVPTVSEPYSEQPTPDGRWLVRYQEGSLSIRPTSGGDWKSLASGLRENLKWATTPDGDWIIYHARDAQGEHSLYRVPITGGTPQRLGDFPSNEFLGSVIRMSPDGRRILASDVQIKQYDLWLLENFEPAPK